MLASELVQRAFDRLAERNGYDTRQDQVQLALLLSDLIEGGSNGVFEAPTGLGKSLAALIPAIANAIANDKRTVIGTYTNVLAEQYWRKDLPLALSLFDEDVKTAFLIGRQRYACLVGMDEHLPQQVDDFRRSSRLGIETEFRKFIRKPAREAGMLWSKIAVPPVCPGKMCPAYDDCFYYEARRKAEKASIIITNHSVIIQDALAAVAGDDGEGMMGKVDFIIVDEAHDLPSAAVSGLEFEISSPKLNMIGGVVGRLENSLLPMAQKAKVADQLTQVVAKFREELEQVQKQIIALGIQNFGGKIVNVSPPAVLDHPAVKNLQAKSEKDSAIAISALVCEACAKAASKIDQVVDRIREENPDSARSATESARTYLRYLREFGDNAGKIFEPRGESVSYLGSNFQEPMLRTDLIDVAGPLSELIWDRVPYACLSATLAVDGAFDHFKRVTGTKPQFSELLPTPYDFSVQAALYLPPKGLIPDPSAARANGDENSYYYALAQELKKIIEACEGRTLALFHSRKEMDAVRAMIDLGPDYPILTQTKAGVAEVGERFKGDKNTSLFALRSFWTGFDAPGDTLICIVLVRIPFEVPTEPAQIGRLAYLAQQEMDPFAVHTLPNAKMIMRQGAGRLIRSTADYGVIAILDPRVQTKRYGEEILDNLPRELRRFTDFHDALGHVKASMGL